MNEIEEQLARRDRFMRRRWAAMSPEKRIQAMMDLQQKAWDLLRSSPNGYAHFLRRNFKARAINVEEPHAS